MNMGIWAVCNLNELFKSGSHINIVVILTLNYKKVVLTLTLFKKKKLVTELCDTSILYFPPLHVKRSKPPIIVTLKYVGLLNEGGFF